MQSCDVALDITVVHVLFALIQCSLSCYSKATVQCLKSARANKKHALHALAGTVLEQIAASAGKYLKKISRNI